MEVVKTIFVTGATGNQGGAVAKNLLSKGFRVKALTRNDESAKANVFQKLHAEIIKGDLDKPDTFKHHLENIDGIFSVQTFEKGIAKEIKQGIALADLAKQFNIPHFLYSSVAGADLHTGIPHFESKLVIEEHIKRIGLPFTILRPVSLYENFLIPQVKLRLVKGKLVSPLNKNAVQQFVAADDIGRMTEKIFADRESYLGKTFTLASEEMDLTSVAQTFSEALNKEIKYQHLPWLITRLAMGKYLYKMFKWVDKNNAVFMKDLEVFKNEHPDFLNLKQWIKLYFNS